MWFATNNVLSQVTVNFITCDLFDLMIWFDFFGLQSPQLVEHWCSARMNWDINKVIVVIVVVWGLQTF